MERTLGTVEYRVSEIGARVGNLDLRTQMLEKDFIELQKVTSNLSKGILDINNNLIKVKYAAYGIAGTIVANSIGIIPVIQNMIGL